MTKASDAPNAMPRWAMALASVAITGHVFAIVIGVLVAPSGPWPAEGSGTLSTPPQFAYSLNAMAPADYLQALGMTSHYHFAGNRPAVPGAKLEFRLEDDAGKLLTTVTIPDPDRPFAVRHRQQVLTSRLADDVPAQPPEGELIAAPSRSVPTVDVWEPGAPRELVLKSVPEHLIPRDRPVFSPSPQSMLLARSYARALCRKHGAAKAEVIRHTQEPIPPAIMFMAGPGPSDADGKLVSRFGRLPE